MHSLFVCVRLCFFFGLGAGVWACFHVFGMCVHLCVFMSMCMYTHVFMFWAICIFMWQSHTHRHTCMHASWLFPCSSCTCVHALYYVCIQIYVYVCVCVHTHTHNTHTHTHRHYHINGCRPFALCTGASLCVCNHMYYSLLRTIVHIHTLMHTHLHIHDIHEIISGSPKSSSRSRARI